MSRDHDSFLAAIIAAPEDDAPRLIYADWLEGQGECERAEFIRVQCKIADINLELLGDENCESPQCTACAEREALRRRSRELSWGCREWSTLRQPWSVGLACQIESLSPPKAEFHRGFVERIECSWQDWLSSHKGILRATPIRTVKLTTRPEWSWIDQRNPRGLIRGQDRDWANEALAAEWPRIRFELPPTEYRYSSLLEAALDQM